MSSIILSEETPVEDLSGISIPVIPAKVGIQFIREDHHTLKGDLDFRLRAIEVLNALSEFLIPVRVCCF